MLSALIKTLIYAATLSLAAAKTYNVLIINFDPLFEKNGKTIKQHELLSHWNDPHELIPVYISDMAETSHGNVEYNIYKEIELDEFPKSTDGFSYTKEKYYETLMKATSGANDQYWTYSGWEDHGWTFDYVYYFEKYDVFDMINNGTIDEVWFFTGPLIGMTLNESTMIGKDAFMVNGGPIHRDGCKNFVAYAFNHERGVGEMLENSGHRLEYIMDDVFGTPEYDKDYSNYTDWEKFTAYDQVTPGKAGAGNVHFAPNSESDYDWGNKRTVLSYCANWLNYPDLSGEPKEYTCSEWGNGDIRLHHKWWFEHVPYAEGTNDETGKYNNWWRYFTFEHYNNAPSAETTTTIPDPEPTPISPYTSIDTCTFDEIPDKVYTGKEIKPDVTIKDGKYTLVWNLDYTLLYTNNVNVGTATIKVIGLKDYEGTKTITFKIIPQDKVKISKVCDRIYSGSHFKPRPKIRNGDIKLKIDIDYSLSYKGTINAGKNYILVKFRGNYKGAKYVPFNILPKDVDDLKYSIIKDQTYKGKAIRPALTIKYGSILLKEGKDYKYSISNNVKPGKAKITIEGKDNYTGTKTIYFKIVKK